MATNGKLASRKFLAWCMVFVSSTALAWGKPDFVGNGQVLFTFWVFMLGLYFGANVVEKTTQSKVNPTTPAPGQP